MKKTYLCVAVLLLCAVLLFTACGGAEEETVAEKPETAVATAVVTEAPAQPGEPEESEEAAEPAAPEMPEEAAEEPEEKEPRTDFIPGTVTAESGTLVGSIESDKYHYPTCRWVDEILPENETWFADAADAESKGYTPCATCH